MSHKINYLLEHWEGKTIQGNDRGFWVSAPFCVNLDLKTKLPKTNQHDADTEYITDITYSVEM